MQAKQSFEKGQLGQAVELRYTPRLKFVMDDAHNRGDRVLHILDELNKKSPMPNVENEEDPFEND